MARHRYHVEFLLVVEGGDPPSEDHVAEFVALLVESAIADHEDVQGRFLVDGLGYEAKFIRTEGLQS